MKTSLRRLRGAVHHKHQAKDRRDLRALTQKDELAQASQEMQDMRDCYDGLLSAAAATANSAYEFSESLQELGSCLLEKTALNDDEESGRVLLMLGKVQFELQKLVDNYRSHIFQTITSPSESLLNELRIVEEMKRLCDEKRNVYEHMLMKTREKERSRSGKGETFSMNQLQEAQEEYDNEATLFFFRLKSLKQGQTRSLLTQAARHHAAQLCFFKKALKSLEEVEPHVKMVTESQHIAYHFSGLYDEDEDDEIENNDDDDGSEAQDDGELSFDYRVNDNNQEDAVSAKHFSSELGQSDITFPQVAASDTPKENVEANYRISNSLMAEIRAVSQSAPLLAENRTPLPAEKLLQMRSSFTRKFNTYVLPTPSETRSPASPAPGNTVSHPLKMNTDPRMFRNIWCSSPLEAMANLHGSEKVSRSVTSKGQVLRESNKNTSSRLPPPLADGLSYSRHRQQLTSDTKRLKRQSFSGPITSKPLSSPPQLYSGPIVRNPISKPPSTSPKISSPTFLSSPKISELHELPRPPDRSMFRSSRALGHSAPLVPQDRLLSTARNKPLVSNSASPLPQPPPITRSFSIPTNSLKVAALDMSKASTTEDTEKIGAVGGTVSPPLTPVMSAVHPKSVARDFADFKVGRKQGED
ncbi:PREDICTED: uncharacterized protein At2g33490-like isoform X2 [Tarenaya hassleriana]|uniref:uncharacterized protein At2g33490-like isoform X1 n=1 Tax=Tarenaya hassleriana TaxID=28532 RepID=UPI00053C8ED0|nr:PREDICTED: uncharacterized protein At2g33490-like isoform X1 [Tarenaya hassleriana]XP_010549300.1 PREDICTED: uncharacterized protein At2g33490-like isoform X2 [Tarenaya hassleriana]